MFRAAFRAVFTTVVLFLIQQGKKGLKQPKCGPTKWAESIELPPRTSFWPMFNLPYVTVEEEYRLFDTVDIIASTGAHSAFFWGSPATA